MSIFDSSAGTPCFLYHGMSERTLSDSLELELRGPSFWGTQELAEYYAFEASQEDGSQPVVLCVPLDRFDLVALRPDKYSLDTPLLSVLDFDEDEIMEQWTGSEKTWLDSLRIVGAVVYLNQLPLLLTDATFPNPNDLEF